MTASAVEQCGACTALLTNSATAATITACCSHMYSNLDVVKRGCLVLHNLGLDTRHHAAMLRAGVSSCLQIVQALHGSDALVTQCTAATAKRCVNTILNCTFTSIWLFVHNPMHTWCLCAAAMCYKWCCWCRRDEMLQDVNNYDSCTACSLCHHYTKHYIFFEHSRNSSAAIMNDTTCGRGKYHRTTVEFTCTFMSSAVLSYIVKGKQRTTLRFDAVWHDLILACFCDVAVRLMTSHIAGSEYVCYMVASKALCYRAKRPFNNNELLD
eukprot:15246-Heterococcus_DN1.PRE.2